MSVLHVGGMARLARRIAHRADAGLALAASRNAEQSLKQTRTKDLDDARSVRELSHTLPLVVPGARAEDVANVSSGVIGAPPAVPGV